MQKKMQEFGFNARNKIDKRWNNQSYLYKKFKIRNELN